MKIVYGAIAGAIGGLIVLALGIEKVKKQLDEENKVEGIQGRVASYKEGWTDGKNWSTALHEIHHPDCDSCPH